MDILYCQVIVEGIKMSSENIYLHMISFQGIYQLYIQIQYSNARQWLELALQSENESYSSS